MGEWDSPYIVWMGLRKPRNLEFMIGSLTKDGSPANDCTGITRCVEDERRPEAGQCRIQRWEQCVDRAVEEMLRGNPTNKAPKKDAARFMRNYFLKYCCLLVRKQNDAATLEVSLVVSYRTKHTLTVQSSNHTP